MNKQPSPPKYILRFFRWFCHPELHRYIEGDLLELYEERIKASGRRKANIKFALDVLLLFRPSIIKSVSASYQPNHYSMFKNYFKTSYRNMVRSKLFTTINVVGLAVSMSVGLLMVAFISDLLSYDNFHKKKDRIYRVITTNQPDNGPAMNLASTSIKAGYQIRETISNVDTLTILRRGFSGDAAVGDHTVPLQALWADHSFFNVFTYPLLQGDPATALAEPYSLVLTEPAAEKLFGRTDVVGQSVTFDTVNYLVTGVVPATPKLSHLQFEALVSFATFELQNQQADEDATGWENIFMNHVYLLLPQGQSRQALQASLDQLSDAENTAIQNRRFMLSLQPLSKISIGSTLTNEIGKSVNNIALWVLLGLTFVVILSACFNYANLSMARALKRSREVGIRKVVGARKSQVISQFLTEAVMVSVLALVGSFGLFLLLKQQFTALHSYIDKHVVLDLSPTLLLSFGLLAVVIGMMAGVLPAVFFSQIKVLHVLKGLPAFRAFRRVTMRKSLIVTQYTFSLMFITATIIGYHQYQNFLAFDLGFNTENVLNIDLQGNQAELLTQKLAALPAVSEISQSALVSSLGSAWSTHLKYQDPNDSTSVWQNFVDEHYLPLHAYSMVAGKNFTSNQQSQAIVNEKLLQRFGIGENDPSQALGEVITLDGEETEIVGVVKDFHYETLEDAIKPVVFRYSSDPGRYLNVKISATNWPETLENIERAWKELDPVHPLNAKLYDDQLAHSYSPYVMMVKVIGFLAFLAVLISSIGLFGMVVFTTETKRKEISIRKVLGAGEGSLMYLLSKSFFNLLIISALIALPITYLFFDQVVLSNVAYHSPIGLKELLTGLVGVLTIALLMIGSQTIRAVRVNPAKTLSEE
ncbi:ABC transporter permease [Tunicatimonas pelagia]|uniref:ABC transporter permease n=1 Tax=Tunicatimonas pelagia TaxID=931531 RepID=UPI00266642A9|nr:ABC transporter permease [Tunicatimonas pelagia]WKN43709.1 ABC transporter permease [Tunicatimonas pelagia]